jgi:hypothetical protein
MTMCFKKSIPATITSTHVYLGMGINDYFGEANDLRGCINDINFEVKKLNKEFPQFQCLKYFDSQVTTQFFMSEVRRVMKEVDALCKLKGEKGFIYLKYSGHGTQIPSASELNGYNEAIYLHNGPLIDDNIYQLQQETPDTIETFLAKFDSCFSGDIGSRDLAYAVNIVNNPHGYRKPRFMPLPGVEIKHNPVNRLAKTDAGQRWIIYSGCGETQTSSDAFIDGNYCGAFSWADMKSYGPGSGHEREIELIRERLYLNKFQQVPEISGPYAGKFMPV